MMYKAFINTVNEEDKNEGGGLRSIVLIVSGDSSAS